VRVNAHVLGRQPAEGGEAWLPVGAGLARSDEQASDHGQPYSFPVSETGVSRQQTTQVGSGCGLSG